MSHLGFLLQWRHTTTIATLLKKKHFIVVAYISICLVQHHHSATWGHAGRCGDREVVQCPTSWLAGIGTGLRHWSISWTYMGLQILLPQWHSSSNKVTLPNQATPYEIIRANYIQSTSLSILYFSSLIFCWHPSFQFIQFLCFDWSMLVEVSAEQYLPDLLVKKDTRRNSCFSLPQIIYGFLLLQSRSVKVM